MTHPDGRDVALGVGVIGESQQQTGFADTRVADEEELWEDAGGAAKRVGGGGCDGARSDVRMEMIQAEGWQAGIGPGTKE